MPGSKPTVYDKAEYHLSGAAIEKDRDYNPYVMTGMYLGWAVQRALTSQEFEEECEEELQRFRRRKLTAPKLYEMSGEALLDDMLSETGNLFTEEYYGGPYMSDFNEVLTGDLEHPLLVKDAWGNYDKLKQRLDAVFDDWLARNPQVEPPVSAATNTGREKKETPKFPDRTKEPLESGLEQVAQWRGFVYLINDLAWSNDGRTFALVHSDSTVTLVDASTGEQKARLKGKSGSLHHHVAFSPDGKQLAYTGFCTLFVRDGAGKNLLQTIKMAGDVGGLAYSSDGNLAAIDMRLKIFDPTKFRVVSQLRNDRGFESFAFSHDSRLVIGSGHGGVIHVWDSASGKQVREWDGGTPIVKSVAVSGSWLLTRGFSHELRIWDLNAGSLAATVPNACERTLRVSPDGRFVACTSQVGEEWQVVIRRIPSLEIRHTIRGRNPEGGVFSPDGKILATWHCDTAKTEAVCLWRVPEEG